MANNSGANSRMCLEKETSWGTNSIDTSAIQVFFESEDIKRTREYAEDNSNLGKRIRSGKYPTYLKVNGSMKINSYPEMLNWLLWFLMGKSKGTANIGKGWVNVYYVGTGTTATLSYTSSNSQLKSLVNGTASTQFGTAGIITTTSSNSNTVGELASKINAYADYIAYSIGSTSALVSEDNISTFTSTSIKGVTKMINSLSSTSTYKQHTFYPIGSNDTLPSFSICRDDTVDVTTFTGCKLNELTLELEPGTILKGSASLSGKTFESDTYPSLTVTDTDPFVVADTIKVYINGVEALYISKATLTITNNISDGDKALGVATYAEMQAQMLDVKLSGEFFWNDTIDEFVDGYDAGTAYELVIVADAEQNLDTVQSIPYRLIVRIPKAKLTECQTNIGGADRLTTPFTFEAEQPETTTYEPIEITIYSRTTAFA